jgi:hypothetical protein
MKRAKRMKVQAGRVERAWLAPMAMRMTAGKARRVRPPRRGDLFGGVGGTTGKVA